MLMIYNSAPSPNGDPRPAGQTFGSIISVSHTGTITSTTDATGQLSATRLPGFGATSGIPVVVTGGDTFTLADNT